MTTQNIAPVFSLIFDELTDGVCGSDSGGRILYLNPAAERMLGIRLPEARGRSLCELLCSHLSTPGANDSASGCPLRDASRPEKTVTFDGEYRHGSSYRWESFAIRRADRQDDLLVRCSRLPAAWLDSAKPEIHLTILEDVTAERELARRKEDWRNMVAHDLRTPLTMIFAALRELQYQAEAPSNLVDLGVRSCRKMMELLDLYLDVAKLDAGLMRSRPARLDLREYALRAAEDQRPLADERRIEVQVDVPAGLSAFADADLLSRVLQNLLNNALKFTPAGGQVAIIGKTVGAGSTALAVQDSGPGIEPEELPRLFDRYHQAEARRSGKIKGTGLGLAFCQEALKAMSGDIRVDSKPGKGCTFTVVLPKGG